MEKLKIVIKKYWKIYLAALVISAVCDLIGTVKLNIGVGTLTLFPMVFAVIFGGLLGPDIFKVFKTEECKIGGSLVLVVWHLLWQKWAFLPVQILQNWFQWVLHYFFRNSETLERFFYLCLSHYCLV